MIVWQDNRPFWEFTKTTAYPVELQVNGKTPTVYVYLNPYTADALKDVLRKAVPGYRRDKRDVEIEREDRSIYAPLFDSYFVKLGNATGTPEQQRAWLDKYPELKPSIIEFSFGGLRADPVESSDVDDVLDITSELSGTSRVYQDLYDSETDKVVRVDMIHSYTHPTEAQYREYRSARRNKFIQKRTMWTVSENHGMLENLYDATVQSITGAVVAGQPCTASNKSAWLPHVPLWHKLWIVDRIFSEIVEKNV